MTAPVRFPAQTIPDGKYRADLELYQGTLLLARVELYQFQVQDRGNKTSVTVTRDGALFLIQP